MFDFMGDIEREIICWSLLVVEGLVIVKRSSPKNLSADCQSTVGRLSADSWPTDG